MLSHLGQAGRPVTIKKAFIKGFSAVVIERFFNKRIQKKSRSKFLSHPFSAFSFSIGRLQWRNITAAGCKNY
jgi:hypothetical protein